MILSLDITNVIKLEILSDKPIGFTFSKTTTDRVYTPFIRFVVIVFHTIYFFSPKNPHYIKKIYFILLVLKFT